MQRILNEDSSRAGRIIAVPECRLQCLKITTTRGAKQLHPMIHSGDTLVRDTGKVGDRSLWCVIQSSIKERSLSLPWRGEATPRQRWSYCPVLASDAARPCVPTVVRAMCDRHGQPRLPIERSAGSQ